MSASQVPDSPIPPPDVIYVVQFGEGEENHLCIDHKFRHFCFICNTLITEQKLWATSLTPEPFEPDGKKRSYRIILCCGCHEKVNQNEAWNRWILDELKARILHGHWLRIPKLPRHRHRPKPGQNFVSWLLEQANRNSPIGDLASDLHHDPKGKRRRTYRGLLQHLESIRACDGAIDACKEAHLEFMGTAYQPDPVQNKK